MRCASNHNPFGCGSAARSRSPFRGSSLSPWSCSSGPSPRQRHPLGSGHRDRQRRMVPQHRRQGRGRRCRRRSRPLLGWALAAWFTAYQLRHISAHTGEVSRRLLPRFLGGYAAAAALVALLTLAGPVRPTVAGLIACLSVPIVASGVVVLLDDADLADRLPPWVDRAVRPAVWGLVTLAGLGAVLVLVMFAVRWPTVTSLHAAVGAHGASAVGLLIGQLLFVPDLAVWAVSFIAGPGFQVAAGGTVSVSGAAPGLLPMIPILGVVPSDGHYPPG